MTKKDLQLFKNEFFEYYSEYLISAEIDLQDNLIVYIKPFIDFDKAVEYISDSILDTVSFDEHLDVHIHEFGSNEFVEIGIN